MKAGEDALVPAPWELLGSAAMLQGFQCHSLVCGTAVSQCHRILRAAQTVLVPEICNLCRIPKYKKSALSRAIGWREEERWCDNPEKDVRQIVQSLHKLGHENKFSISAETKTHFFLENKSSADRNSANCAKVDKHGKLLHLFIYSWTLTVFQFLWKCSLGD